MKRCSHCKIEKEASEFSRNRSRPDGLSGYCKPCSVAAVVRYQSSDKGKETAKKCHINYYKTHRDNVIASVKAYQQTDAGKRSQQKRYIKRRLAQPDKYEARYKLGNAVKLGHIVAPTVCQDCGKITKTNGHHTDYSKPLDVVWLCKKCHGRIHRKAETL